MPKAYRQKAASEDKSTNFILTSSNRRRVQTENGRRAQTDRQADRQTDDRRDRQDGQTAVYHIRRKGDAYEQERPF